MWKKTILFLGFFIVSSLIGYYCGHLINVAYNVEEYDLVLCMFFMILSVLIVACGIKIRDEKILKEIHSNQIKAESSKKFPLYGAYNKNVPLFFYLSGFLVLFLYNNFCELSSNIMLLSFIW